METKWRVDYWDCSATQIDVVAETAQFATVRYKKAWGDETYDLREKKDGRFFETFEKAKAALVADAERRISYAEYDVRHAQEKLAKAHAMQQPSSEPDTESE